MSIDTTKWFESISDIIAVSAYKSDPGVMAGARFLQDAMRLNKEVISRDFNGILDEKLEPEIEKELIALAGRSLAKETSKDLTDRFFVWDQAYVSYRNSDSNGCNVNISSFDQSLLDQIESVFKKRLTSKISSGNVYVIANGRSGPKFKALGAAALPLELENYAPKVAESVQHVVQDLGSNTPCGRMVILDGPPGSGKSFLVRGIISSVKDAMWVIVPPDMVGELVGPSLISLIAENKDEPGPIVFIIEDGDRILAPRGSDNMHVLSGLLNLSDGLLGSLMDVRIVATTNAPHSEIEEALLRPGRLCRRINVGDLGQEQA